MTDEQIMQGLKWCYQVEGSCGDCPYRPDDIKKAKCHNRLGNDVIDLIYRQQNEIAKWRKRFNQQVDAANETIQRCEEREQVMKNQAIKEFASKFDDVLAEMRDEYHKFGKISYGLVCETVHAKLAMFTKKMVGEGNARNNI